MLLPDELLQLLLPVGVGQLRGVLPGAPVHVVVVVVVAAEQVEVVRVKLIAFSTKDEKKSRVKEFL